MTGFSIDWLDLRESVDLQARDKSLAKLAIRWLKNISSPDQLPLILDLGSGTGSTVRSFDSLLDAESIPARWRLIDNDPNLLSEAKRRYETSNRIETCLADLSNIQKISFQNVNLVTTSALLDLVSANFVRDLAQTINAQSQLSNIALYSALNYDGTAKWNPQHPLDEKILSIFNEDQCKDKGFGPALGPGASECFKDEFQAIGFTIMIANSPWELEPDDHELTNSLIDGFAEVALQREDCSNSEIENWRSFRKNQLTSGSCQIGHIDSVALPPKKL
ncbi:MAG: class I SAM-dependent methyltransferase [Gammaproteobacteria bacterium]|nr:class I SAM-dependent methyltransferase [Gammaproteobacteria bacterium]